jgi:outer membrane protein TolC/ABC-type uncharacterized transport system substrate-binding protein
MEEGMKRWKIFVAGLLVWGFLMGPASAALPLVRIAIVEDGPSLRYNGLEELKREIRDLSGDEFDIRFPETLHFSGNWEVPAIRRQVEKALASRDADLVIATGVIASHLLCGMGDLPKPAIAAVIIAADLQNLPESHGTSGVKNLNYIKSFQNFDRDLRAFRSMVPFGRLAIIGDASIKEGLPDLNRRTRIFGEASGLDITFLSAREDADLVLKALSPDTEAVFITPLQRFSPEAFARLTEGLIARKIPSFSLWGREEVAQGVLAGLAPSERIPRLSRRVALHVQQILMGRDAGGLSVSFHPDTDFTVNMETARRIGVYPDWDVLLDADILHEDPHPEGRALAINEAVREAIAANLEMKLAEGERALAEVQARSRRAPLKPQALVELSGKVLDRDNAASSLGRQAEEEVWLELLLRQSLFSEKDRSLRDVADLEVKSRRLMERQVGLDIAESATLAFIDVLRASRQARIRKDDLDLTRANLERAETRREVGYAGPSEVYRWQSRLASSRKALLDARAQVRQAEIRFNTLLNRPLDQPLHLEDTRLSDPLFFVSDPRIRWFSENPRRIRHFHDFVVMEARDQAPELARIALAMESVERSLLAARRSWYLPDVLAEGGMRQRLVSEGEGSGAVEMALMPGVPPIRLPGSEDFGWQVALKVRYPLYTGGARSAAQDEALERLEALRTQRLRVAEGLEARMRAALHRTTASWPGIRLSGDAAEAARKNLELVTDAYERGVISAMELLDAQHASLVAEQGSAASVYDFLKDLMGIQRLLGNVDFSATLEGRDAMFRRLRQYFEEAGIAVPALEKGEAE